MRGRRFSEGELEAAEKRDTKKSKKASTTVIVGIATAVATLISGGVSAGVSYFVTSAQILNSQNEARIEAIMQYIGLANSVTDTKGYFGKHGATDPKEEYRALVKQYELAKDKAAVVCTSQQTRVIGEMDRLADEAITNTLYGSAKQLEAAATDGAVPPALPPDKLKQLADFKEELLRLAKEG